MIDTRFVTTCSLGPILSGSVSDDPAQQTGLIKVTGSLLIAGVITPAIGTPVTVTYARAGSSWTIPRSLRVLSSFADPIKRQTSVKVGCTLTYQQDLREPINWTAFDDPANTLTADDARIITVPIRAQAVAEKCMAELGITGSFTLTNSFSIAEFDLSGGYVEVLSRLLEAECLRGRLDASNVLQVFSINQEGGTGPVIDATQLVEINEIGVGQLPGETVTVSYSTLKLKPAVTTGSDAVQRRNWELSISYGTKTEVDVSYTTTDDPPSTITVTYTYVPYSVTTRRYDRWDRMIRATVERYSILAEVAPSCVVNMLTLNGIAPGATVCKFTTVTTVEYASTTTIYTSNAAKVDKPENYDKIVRQTEYQSEPLVKVYASSQAYDLATSEGFVLGFQATEVVTSISITDFNSVKESQFAVAGATGSTQASLATGAQISETTNQQYKSYAYTQRGSQYVNQYLNNLADVGLLGPGVTNFLNETAKLVPAGTSTEITIGREIGLQRRPNAAERINADNGGQTVASTSELSLAMGSATAQRRLELTLPIAPDDTFAKVGGVYSSVPSDAPQKAQAYGLAENRLLLGARNGVSLQASPLVLPSTPFAPFILRSGGVSALYRVNALNWTFGPDGMVLSADALFWGGVGGTGDRWFPVAPGITTLPAAPATTTVNITGAGGVIVASYQEMAATALVPIYNETRQLTGTLRVRSAVEAFPYPLQETATIESSVRIRSQLSVGLLIDVPAAAATAIAQAPAIGIGTAIRLPGPAAAAAMRYAPTIATSRAVIVPALVATATAHEPEQVGRPATLVQAPAAAATATSQVPTIATGASVTMPARNASVTAQVPTISADLILSLNPVFYWNPSVDSTVTLSGSEIQSISDQGSRGWTLSKSTTGPQIYTDGNGKKWIDWGTAGHNNYLRNTTTTSTSIAEWYIVVDANYGSTFPGYNGLITGTVDGDWFVAGNASTAELFPGSYDQVFLNGSTTNSYSSVLTTINSPALMRIKKANDSAVTLTTGVQLGNDRSNSGRGWGGLVGAVIGFSAPLSTTNRNALQSSLASAFGITLV